MSIETIKCISCDSLVELPANFCEMCGTTLNVQTVTEKPELEDSKELILRIIIPVVAVAMGLYLLFSKYPSSGMLLLLLLPLIIGTVVGSINSDQMNSLQSKSINWCLLKLSGLKDKDGKRHRYFFRPWHWMLTQLISYQEKITNPFVRAGFLCAAFLYLTGIMFFLIYMAVAVVVTIILIGIICWFIFMIMEGGGSSQSSKILTKRILPKDKLRGKDIYDNKGLLSSQIRHIDEDGNVYDTTGMVRRKVAKIDDDGKIRDMTGAWKSNVGEIDEDGNITDTTGTFHKKVGEIDEDGKIYDTTGMVREKKGKIQ